MRRSARGRLLAFCLAIALVTLSGCWDFRQVNERAFVLMIGVDRAEGGKGYRVTTQEIVGQYLPGAQAGGGGGGSRRPWLVLEAEGANVPQALENVRVKIHRDLEFSHLKVFVLGEDVAREDIRLMDQLSRDLKIPSTVFLAVAHGKAADVVSAPNAAEDVPALYVFHAYTGRYARSLSIIALPIWYVVARTAFNPLEDGVASGLAVQNGELQFSGSAVWNGRKMAGWLDARETRLVTLFLKLKQIDDVLVTEGEPGTALRVSSARTRYWADWASDGTVVLHVRTSFGGDLISSAEPVVTLEDQAEAEATLEATLAKRTEALIRRLQELGSDPFGFGERLRRLDSTAPEVRDGSSWKKAYASARIDVVSEVTFTKRGYSR